MAPRRWVKRSLQGGAEDSQTACKKEEVETPSLRPSLSTEGASVAVVGGGFAGLFCAERLAELGFDVTLFRARSRLSATQMEHEHNTAPSPELRIFILWFCQGKAREQCQQKRHVLKPRSIPALVQRSLITAVS